MATSAISSAIDEVPLHAVEKLKVIRSHAHGRYKPEHSAAESSDNNKTSISTADGYYGLNIGFLFYVTDDIDLDIGYHYYFMDRLEPLDTMNGPTFSLHYFY
jgi:hypothetical protein